ncbi:MAG: GNAT family N-acetyltransferase, partial [candidate division Zixibacteria bacterium]|nr:GNAT family N-acetyltransferase [candidate division Zixibacteria bacterium]
FTEEDRKKGLDRLQKVARDERTSNWGLYRDGNLLGSMRLINYTMSLFGQGVAAGGLSMVAVSLLHKKEAVAREMVEFYLRYYRDRNAAWAILWPFRPDFYHDMGFGYGGKMNVYRIKPADFPKGPTKEHVRQIGVESIGSLLESYNRLYPQVNGLVDENDINFQNRLEFYPEIRYSAVEIGGRFEAYYGWRFESAHTNNTLVNNMRGLELVYHTREALAELFTFLRSQVDQIKEVIIRTPDPDFHFLPNDPRDGSDQMLGPIYHQSHQTGVGAMYRIIDLERALTQCAHHNFNDVSLRLKINLRDTFLPENAGSVVAVWERGMVSVDRTARYDVEITLDVAEFSSLLLGAVRFRSLYDYRRAEISDTGKLGLVDRLFTGDRPVACLTSF